MKLRYICTVTLLGILIAVHGCSKHRDEIEIRCIENMQILESAAHSYMLEHNLSPTNIVNPERLKVFIKGSELRCPLSNTPYPAFEIGRGPECPSSQEHTRKYRDQRCPKQPR
jgi:competence protein ComGC